MPDSPSAMLNGSRNWSRCPSPHSPAARTSPWKATPPILLAPGEFVTLPEAFVMAHSGDHFAALDTYRRTMAERGLGAPAIPESSYAPIWCAWGYERNFTPEQVYGTLDKAQGRRAANGRCSTTAGRSRSATGSRTRPSSRDGNADMKAFADRIKSYGMRPKLWISPLSADAGKRPDARSSRHAAARRRWRRPERHAGGTAIRCARRTSRPWTISRPSRRIIGDWGFEGLKIDGQHLNGVAPCYNPAHNHARPEESVEKLQDFWKAIYETAIGHQSGRRHRDLSRAAPPSPSTTCRP